MSTPAFPFRIVLALAGLAGVAVAAPAPTAEEIIAKARGYLGTEAALTAVKSVRFVGTMETEEPAAQGARKVSSPIEIIFQKPYRQRIVLTTESTIQTTGLDDYDGWQRLQERSQGARWRLALLQAEMIKKLRANTWENLNFYQGIEKRGGSVQVVGPVTTDGVATIKVVFIHEPGISFTRYFDAATGRLVLTETDRGDRIREEGDMLVNGVRFPRKVTSTSTTTDAAGKPVESRTVITFDRITVNEVFANDVFEVPMIPTSQESPPAVETPAVETPAVVPTPAGTPPAAPAAAPQPGSP